MYHLTRANGDPLLIHPFRRQGSTFSLLSAPEIRGFYGREPRVESLTMLRNNMYRRIEEDVRDWIAEKRFMPRFLSGAAVFLVTYLVLSLVVRDPIPMVDELLVATGASLGTYFVLGRRDMRSEEASKRRIALRNKVDGVVFTGSDFVQELETTLQRYEGIPRKELLESLNTAKAEPIWAEHGEEATRFLDTVTSFLDSKRIKQLERRLQKGKTLGALADPRKLDDLDLPLVLLYLELKAELASV